MSNICETLEQEMEQLRRPHIMLGRPIIINMQTGEEESPVQVIPLKESKPIMSNTYHTSKVIETGNGINPRIKGRIVYKTSEGYYFVEEPVFKNELIRFLDKPESVKQFTDMQASLDIYTELITNGKLKVEPYSIDDPSIPNHIVPLVF